MFCLLNSSFISTKMTSLFFQTYVTALSPKLLVRFFSQVMRFVTDEDFFLKILVQKGLTVAVAPNPYGRAWRK